MRICGMSACKKCLFSSDENSLQADWYFSILLEFHLVLNLCSSWGRTCFQVCRCEETYVLFLQFHFAFGFLCKLMLVPITSQ